MSSLLFSALRDEALYHPLRTLLVTAVVVPLTYLVVNEIVRRKARISTFDGPPGLPLIGNIADIKYNAAEKYRQWSKPYGDVYQIQLGNVPVIVVNSAASAKAIFGQYSQALSSRPVFYTFHKVGQAVPFADRSTLTECLSKGPLKHRWHDHWHVTFLRVSKATSKRRRVRPQ